MFSLTISGASKLRWPRFFVFSRPPVGGVEPECAACFHEQFDGNPRAIREEMQTGVVQLRAQGPMEF